MSPTAKADMGTGVENVGTSAKEYNVILELSKRLDALWRYDQDAIAHADGEPQIRLWRDLKQQEQENTRHLKEFAATACASSAI